MTDFSKLYRELGVEATASWDEIRQSHRNLLSRWHPDRYTDNDAERRTAEERTKAINHAFQSIMSYFDEHGRLPLESRYRAVPEPIVEPSRPQTAAPSPHAASAPVGEPPRNVFRRALTMSLMAGLVVGYVLWSRDIKAPRHDINAALSDIGNINSSGDATKSRPTDTRRFSVGSTLGEVYSIQGIPTKMEGDTWFYGEATVHFVNGKVSSWLDPTNTLKVSGASPAWMAHFRQGSTKEEVRAAQGSPLRESDTVWDYGLTRVYFDHTGRVSGWEDHPLNPLNIDR